MENTGIIKSLWQRQNFILWELHCNISVLTPLLDSRFITAIMNTVKQRMKEDYLFKTTQDKYTNSGELSLFILSIKSKPPVATAMNRNLLGLGMWHSLRYDSLSKTILHGTLEGGRGHGWQRKCWLDNFKEWPSLPMPELLAMACHKKRQEDYFFLNHPVEGPDLTWEKNKTLTQR